MPLSMERQLTKLINDDNEDIYLVNDEYETQLLGFSPTSFTDKMYNIYFDYTYSGLQGLQNTLIKKCSHLMPEAEIRKACDKILEYSVAELDKTFDKFETFVKRNVLTVDKNIILPEDEFHESLEAKARVRGEAPTLTQLETEIRQLENELAKELQCKASLEKVMADQETVMKNLNVLDEQVETAHELLSMFDLHGKQEPEPST